MQECIKKSMIYNLIERIRKKREEAPSFYLFLLKEFFVLIAAILFFTFLLIKGNAKINANIYKESKINKIIEQKSALQDEDYSSIILKNYIGRKGYIEVVDSKGKVYYSSKPNTKNKYDEVALKYIEDVNTDINYSIVPILKNGDYGMLVIQNKYNQKSGEDVNGIIVLNSNNEIMYTNMKFQGEKLTEKELNYLIESSENLKYDNALVLQKYAFKTNSGKHRFLLIHSESPYHKAEDKSAKLHFALMSFYLTAILLAVFITIFRMSSKMRRPLKQLRMAMNGFARGDREQIDIPQGTKEFNQVVDTFNNMEMQLQKSEESRQQMLADISHDLKTPITVIQGYVDAMRDGLIPEQEMQKYLEIIGNKTTALVELINSFSDFARLEHPKFKYEFRTEDICEFFREYVASKYQELTLAGYKVDVEIPEEVVKVSFDKLQFRRVFENIISNAVKYTEEGTTIYFCLRYGKDIMKIEIGDDGPGIPEEMKEIIFEPFVVAENARSNGQGTGLGLSIAKSIVESHKGKISISDRKINGKGTFYKIILPVIHD